MTTGDFYEGYVREYQAHSDYEDRFFTDLRDRHRAMLDLVEESVAGRRTTRLLDVCCSKGVFLFHLRQRFPKMSLAGMDLGVELIEAARRDPRLIGIEFLAGDLLAFESDVPFEVVTANNGLMLFDDDQFRLAIRNVWNLLQPGGVFIASDIYHPFDHDLKIVERNTWYDGDFITYHRSYAFVRAAFAELGASAVDFRPFQMSKDLPQHDLSGRVSHTVSIADGERLDMRGALYTPYCHFLVRKPPA